MKAKVAGRLHQMSLAINDAELAIGAQGMILHNMTISNITDKFKQIQVKQPIEYIFASILNLICNRSNMTDKDLKEFLDAVEGGWY